MRIRIRSSLERKENKRSVRNERNNIERNRWREKKKEGSTTRI